MVKTKAASNGATDTVVSAFDFTTLQRARYYVWREIDRGDDRPPIRVKLLELSTRQASDIPLTRTTPLGKAMEACAPYVVEWDLQAENLETGEMVDVPPPAEIGLDAFEYFLTDAENGAILSWLKSPQTMLGLEEQKKLKASGSTQRS